MRARVFEVIWSLLTVLAVGVLFKILTFDFTSVVAPK